MLPAPVAPRLDFPPMWRRVERAATETAQGRSDEFPSDAAVWPTEISRRDFLQRMSASLALAGVAGCSRTPAAHIVPRVEAPESALAAGDARYFATAIASEGYARGIVVTAHSGRPTKIEGNPDHPESVGATDALTQAAILSLYDPDRSPAPRHAGVVASWGQFEADWLALRPEFAANGGAGLVLLTEPTTSPTQIREMHRVLDAFPHARWFQHTPLAHHDHRGVEVDHDFAVAEVIFTIESDCFHRHPAAVRYGRALAGRRRVAQGRVTPPRCYALEAATSVTGALADFRLPAAPARLRAVLDAITATLDHASPAAELTADEARIVRALATDLRSHAGRVACVAGPECAPDLRDWALALNQQYGADVTRYRAAQRSDSDARSAGDLAALADLLASERPRAVFVLGCNPVYTSAPDLNLAALLAPVPLVVHLGEDVDETAQHAHWHLPEAHFLETWGDLRDFGGGAVIQQPLIEPMQDSRSMAELLRFLSGAPAASAYDLVRGTWLEIAGAEKFESRWNGWLARGRVDAPAAQPGPATLPALEFPRLVQAGANSAYTVLLRADPNVVDGRHANNPWLQELPRPLTTVVWDNPALVGPQLAAELALIDGDVVACEVGGRSLELPVCIVPGQAPGTVVLTLGYGRSGAGTVGNGVGVNAYTLRTRGESWLRRGAVLRKTGQRRPIVSTQEHFTMEGRDLARLVTPSGAAGLARAGPVASLLPAWPAGEHAWAMSIDLGTCLGCNACVVACQAENNIPVVGREQVARGREMHWLRIDRYYSGAPENPRFVAQPVPCMQCENAPCELVCPVAATVHSSEGLNDMVYNRCVGTRYCSNNCPYKVRRFNFLDYRVPRASPENLRANPNVTIRERGVMEKCTYCVQRINAGRIAAELEHRPMRDGDIRTACQQACPAEAIVFGDLRDPASRVSRRKAEPGNYALLGELNTRPRTTYLPAVRHSPLP